MTFKNDNYSNFVEYIDKNINFEFLSRIPGYDKSPQIQKEAVLKLLNTNYSENEAFLEYISYTYKIFSSNIIKEIIFLSWNKSNGMKDCFINDDKFNLSNEELVNYISVLLLIKDMMHTSYIASLPIYNSYQYEQKEFYERALDIIENSVENISTLVNINPIFISISAKSILPYSIQNDELSSSSKLVAILFNMSRIMASYPTNEVDIPYIHPIFVSVIYNLVNNASFLGLDYRMVKILYDKVKSGEIQWKN